MKTPTTILMLAAFLLCSCGPNQRILNSAVEDRNASPPGSNSNIAPALSSFDQDLQAMRTANFKFIYVLRRRDGGVLDADDKSFISRTTPAQINRRRLSDGEKALIIGSNFRLPDENLEAWRARFSVEDHSGESPSP